MNVLGGREGTMICADMGAGKVRPPILTVAKGSGRKILERK